jgi:hypothetical protein
MGLLDRVRAEASGVRDTSIDGWISDYLIPAVNTFSYGGSNYISNSLGLNHAVDNTTRLMRVSNTLPGYMTALKASAPAFAAQLVRARCSRRPGSPSATRPTTATTPASSSATGPCPCSSGPGRTARPATSSS